MWGFAARLNLARLTCLLLYSMVFEWRSDEQPQFLAIFSTLTAMGCLHKEYERTCSFSRGAKTPGGKEPTWRKIPIVLKIPQRLKSSDKDRHLKHKRWANRAIEFHDPLLCCIVENRASLRRSAARKHAS